MSMRRRLLTAGVLGFALLYRERTGKGQYLDISLLDSYFHYHEVNVQAWSCSKGEIQPTRSGSHHYAVAPGGIFKSRDSYLFLLPILHMWPKLCEIMGRPELAEDPRYIDNASRARNQKDLIAIIEGWLQAQESDEAAIRILEEGHIPVAPILTVPQAIDHPHHRARGTVRRVSDRMLGEFDIPGMPLRFSGHPELPDLQAPFLGEHNGEILTGLLGYDAERVAELESAGVLTSAAH